MHAAITALALIPVGALAFIFWRRQRTLQRETFIRHFAFPKGVFAKVIEHHPQLTQKDMELVSRGLRQFFLAYHRSGHRYVSMPSQIADDLWHEFILYTRHYEAFCQQAFGRFLHHTPAVVLKQSRLGNEGLRRCWHYCCREEDINPLMPSRLPLLFALDSTYQVANGFVYLPDCSGVRREGSTSHEESNVHCGTDFSDDAGIGSMASLLDLDGSSPHLDDGHSHTHAADHGQAMGDWLADSGDGSVSSGFGSFFGSGD